MEGKIMTPAREYRVSKDESERIRILKMWFAIMVVMIHAIFLEGIYLEGGTMAEDLPIWLARTQYFIAEVVSTCAVPGFFFLSAMFLYRKEFTWAGNMRKKVRSLVVPYFLVTTAWIAVYYIGQHVGALRMYFGNPENNVSGWGLWEWINAYLGINRLDRLGQGFNKPLVGPLWFIRDLFVLNALAVLIKKACKIESGSGVPNKTKVAAIKKADLQAIAEQKMPDLNAASLEAAMSMIAGTARSMGVTVED